MKISCYTLTAERLCAQPDSAARLTGDLSRMGETWFDVQEAEAEELRQFLGPLNLHPLQLARCLDTINNPGVVTFGQSLLMEYPAAFDRDSAEPAYLTILLRLPVLVTVRHGAIPALDDLAQGLIAADAPALHHLPEIIYLILDQFADLNVEAQVELRDRILHTSRALAQRPEAVSAADLAALRWQVGELVSLLENQLYCISGLSASDHEALREPHRKAYVQDLLSEAEIAQRGVYRLEGRVNDLYSDYQMAGNDRVEKRLRLLTIISAITLPLGLIAGLLGMNVGGVPGTTLPAGFLIVVGVMLAITLAQYWYFRRNGWFD